MSDSLSWREQVALFWEQIALSLFCSQKTSNSLQKFVVFVMFLTVFHYFFQFFALECRSFVKSDRRDSLLEKSKSLFCSFTHKKWAICTNNQRANFQPWVGFTKAKCEDAIVPNQMPKTDEVKYCINITNIDLLEIIFYYEVCKFTTLE